MTNLTDGPTHAVDELGRNLADEAECQFCGGRPVVSAETWLDGAPRPPAACPRCGERNA